MRLLRALLWLTLTACGAVQQPKPIYDFEDSEVPQRVRCLCAVERTLVDADELGERTVAEQRAAVAGTRQAVLSWHKQPWFDVPESPSVLTVTLEPGPARQMACPAPGDEGCFSYRFMEVTLRIQSEDGVLNEAFTTHLRFWPEPMISEPIPIIAGLRARQSKSSQLDLRLSIYFGGALGGMISVSDPDGADPRSAGDGTIASWELGEPLKTPPAAEATVPDQS